MSDVIEVLLLCALPASGKSETRKFLETRDAKYCRENFHMGATAQLDDYPYVHLMRVIDIALGELGQPGVFFEAPDKCMREPRDWGTLIELLNMDFTDLKAINRIKSECPASWLLERFDACRTKMGAKAAFGEMDAELKKKLVEKIQEEATKLLNDKNEAIPDSLEGKTIVIEFARGGDESHTLPLADPYGYQYSLRYLSKELLAKCAMLYIWVTPEISRAKNQARADPNNPGSILNHGVPEHVMRHDYGTCDLMHMLEESKVPKALTFTNKDGNDCVLPVGIFDNREDKTTFARDPVPEWKDEDTDACRVEMKKAFDDLWLNYQKTVL